MAAGIAEGWAELDRWGRRLVLALLAVTAILVALEVATPAEIERQVADAEQRGLRAAAIALEAALPDLAPGRALDPDELQSVDRLLSAALIDTGQLRVKLWSLDGTILYSDAPQLIGRRYAEVVPRLQEAAALGIYSERNVDEAENALEQGIGPLAEHYIAIHPHGGGPIAVLETYGPIDSVGPVAGPLWLGRPIALLVVAASLIGVALVTARSGARTRETRASLARRFQELASATQTIASSLDADAVIERLREPLRDGLGLTDVSICRPAHVPPGARTVQLGDGRVLAAVARRRLTSSDMEVLSDAARTIDAAADGASRLSQVHGAAAETTALFGRVARARADERRLLISQLHDSLASSLVRTLFAVRRAGTTLNGGPPNVAAAIETVERLVEETEDRLRQFMGSAMPTAADAADLRSATTTCVERFAEESGCRVRLALRGRLDDVPDAIALVLLRALGEGLLNVQRHAQANSVRVGVWTTGGVVRLTIVDDGIGWPATVQTTPGHRLGLRNLAESVRAMGGTLTRARGDSAGARLDVSLPLTLEIER